MFYGSTYLFLWFSCNAYFTWKKEKKVLSYPNRSKGKKVFPNLIQTIIFTFSAQLNQLGDAFCLKKKKSIDLEEYTWIHITYFSQWKSSSVQILLRKQSFFQISFKKIDGPWRIHTWIHSKQSRNFSYFLLIYTLSKREDRLKTTYFLSLLTITIRSMVEKYFQSIDHSVFQTIKKPRGDLKAINKP